MAAPRQGGRRIWDDGAREGAGEQRDAAAASTRSFRATATTATTRQQQLVNEFKLGGAPFNVQGGGKALTAFAAPGARRARARSRAR